MPIAKGVHRWGRDANDCLHVSTASGLNKPQPVQPYKIKYYGKLCIG
jgi:hypothetical protein